MNNAHPTDTGTRWMEWITVRADEKVAEDGAAEEVVDQAADIAEAESLLRCLTDSEQYSQILVVLSPVKPGSAASMLLKVGEDCYTAPAPSSYAIGELVQLIRKFGIFCVFN